MVSRNENSTNNHIVNLQEFAKLLESQPTDRHDGSRPQIHRVPPQLRRKMNHNEIVYDPMTVSLGPYHHGKPAFRQAEEFKYRSLDWCTSGSDDKKTFFYNKVLDNIPEIRGCYADVSSVEKYDDKELALMMLLDACYIINFMETRTRRESNFLDWRNHLGMAAAIPFTSRDIMVLENQIPFQVIKLLTGLQYGEEEGQQIIREFVGWMIVGKSGLICRIPREEEDPPLHILEACRRVMVGDYKSHQQPGNTSSFRWPRFMRILQKKKDKRYVEDSTALTSQTGRSVMDLKAKGIKFKPSSSTSIREVKFRSFPFHGQLQLPITCLSESNWDIILN